jgi:hypothetical protein
MRNRSFGAFGFATLLLTPLLAVSPRAAGVQTTGVLRKISLIKSGQKAVALPRVCQNRGPSI